MSRIRSLLPVQMSKEEEELVRELLWTLVNNHVFFQHPDLIRILKIHENVIAIMMNSIARSEGGGGGGGEGEVMITNAECSLFIHLFPDRVTVAQCLESLLQLRTLRARWWSPAAASSATFAEHQDRTRRQCLTICFSFSTMQTFFCLDQV